MSGPARGVDRRIIFLLILLAVLIPLLWPIGLPIVPTRKVIGLYETIESLPEGAAVLFSADWDPGGAAELYPMAQATLRHLFRKKLRVIVVSMWATAGPLTEQVLAEISGEMGKEYGRDYVNLGFKEGREIVMVSIATDLLGVYPADAYGRPTADMAVLRGVHDMNDIALLVNISGGYPGTKEWLQQVQRRWGVKMASCTTGVSEPEFVPNFQAGQLVGLVGGLAGAAEYEKLITRPGSATRGMDAQSLGHVAIIALIVAANAGALLRRPRAPGPPPAAVPGGEGARP